MLREQQRALVRELRPNALALVSWCRVVAGEHWALGVVCSSFCTRAMHVLPCSLLPGTDASLQTAALPSLQVDSFGIPDYQLNSALGRKDGNVYQVRGMAQTVRAPCKPACCRQSNFACLLLAHPPLHPDRLPLHRRCWTAHASAR